MAKLLLASDSKWAGVGGVAKQPAFTPPRANVFTIPQKDRTDHLNAGYVLPQRYRLLASKPDWETLCVYAYILDAGLLWRLGVSHHSLWLVLVSLGQFLHLVLWLLGCLFYSLQCCSCLLLLLLLLLFLFVCCCFFSPFLLSFFSLECFMNTTH